MKNDFPKLLWKIWKLRCGHVKKIESDYLEKEAIVRNTTENVINLGDDLISSENDCEEHNCSDGTSGVEEICVSE